MNPPHPGPLFPVADCDTTTTRARELGATVTREPADWTNSWAARVIRPPRTDRTTDPTRNER